MAYYARVEAGIVQQVVVLADDQESSGASFLAGLLGGDWVRTFEDGQSRGVFAAPGYRYDAARDVFAPPHWVLDGDAWAPPPPPPGWSLIDGVWTPPPDPEPVP